MTHSEVLQMAPDASENGVPRPAAVHAPYLHPERRVLRGHGKVALAQAPLQRQAVEQLARAAGGDPPLALLRRRVDEDQAAGQRGNGR